MNWQVYVLCLRPKLLQAHSQLRLCCLSPSLGTQLATTPLLLVSKKMRLDFGLFLPITLEKIRNSPSSSGGHLCNWPSAFKWFTPLRSQSGIMKRGANSVAEPDKLFTGTCHPSPIEVLQSQRSSETHEGFPGWRDSPKLVTPLPPPTPPHHWGPPPTFFPSIPSSSTPSSSNQTALQTPTPPLVLPTCQTLGDRGMEPAPLRYQPLTWSFQTDFS